MDDLFIILLQTKKYLKQFFKNMNLLFYNIELNIASLFKNVTHLFIIFYLKKI